MQDPRDTREFDRYADSYRNLHAASIRASGEEPDYFARYKIAEVARVIGATGDIAGEFSLLDFGCGIGGSIPHMRAAFPRAHIVGADVSGESIARARATCAGQAEFAVLQDQRLPFEDGHFDVVFTSCVFHHIEPEQRAAALSEIRRVLKPGGELFFFEHNPWNPLTARAVRDCPFDEHAVLLPSPEAMQRIRDGGFRAPRLSYTVFFPKALAWLRPVERYLRALPAGAQYYVHAHA